MSAMLFLSSTENLNFTEICQKKPLFEQLKNQVLVNSIFFDPLLEKNPPLSSPGEYLETPNPLLLFRGPSLEPFQLGKTADALCPVFRLSINAHCRGNKPPQNIVNHKFCQELLPIKMNTTIWVTLCSRIPRNLCLSPGAADSDSKVRDLT